MFYLTQASEIQAIITGLASRQILWLDTEVADYDTRFPKLSLIQVLAEPNDLAGDSVYILDVFKQPDVVEDFITQIMANAKIEKVFHNSSYDLRYLGNVQAQNVTCTLKIARKISRDRLGTSDLKLKTLARELCNFTYVDVEEGRSDWGRRPLSQKQLDYAKMDTVYLAQVHLRLNSWGESNGQLTLEYETPDGLDNSHNLTLPIETETFVNQLPDSTPKSLKEKCQKLIDLSQRKIDLKKYADQLDGFTSRQEKITNAVREIQPLIIAMRAFRQRGIINFDFNQKVDTLLTVITSSEENFRKIPEWILDNKNFKGNIFTSNIESLKNTLRQHLCQAWKSYLTQHLPSTSKEMLEIFAGLESLRPTLQRIYSLDRQIQEVEFPKNSEDFDRLDKLIEQLRQSLDSLSSDKIPEDVQKFLKAAANQGATIDLLTLEVKEWLIQHRIADYLRIRLT
jgi:hypothetical protein